MIGMGRRGSKSRESGSTRVTNQSVTAAKIADNQGDRILLIDEWIGEGFQIKAALDMIETLGATIVGIACVYLHPDFDSNIELVKKYKVFAANCLVCKYFECRCT